jgi:hypothetical protein
MTVTFLIKCTGLYFGNIKKERYYWKVLIVLRIFVLFSLSKFNVFPILILLIIARD